MSDPRPIGVFDSGAGGLTVLRALQEALPDERFIYIGDTARVPYGNKPDELIHEFAHDISHMLMDDDVKAIVVACNTASAVALRDMQNYLPIPVYGVIDATLNAALTHKGRIGVIGTSATIQSEAYQLPLLAAGRDVWAKNCPMFVPLVEEGVYDEEIALVVAAHYLADVPDSLTTLILGCTHYPLLKRAISHVLPHVHLVDSAHATAAHVAQDLAAQALCAPQGGVRGSTTYMVSGDPRTFSHMAERLGVDVGHVGRTPLTPFARAKEA